MTLEQLIDAAMSAKPGHRHFRLSYDPTEGMGWTAFVAASKDADDGSGHAALGETANSALISLIDKLHSQEADGGL